MNASDTPDPLRAAPIRRAHDRRAYPHLARELATMRAMVRIYCRSLHGAQVSLCPDCEELMRYATRRIDRCVFGEDKPTCARCTVHCYNTAMRERVREVMRYAGPRMIWRHPLLALAHVVDKRREARALPRPSAGAVGDSADRGPERAL
jgi:hypothetical protein